jgi:hypothetical protein
MELIMAKQASCPKPRVPTLYKVLFDGKSCNGGSYEWDTSGGVNLLPANQRQLPLKHCSVGFHLTTDWKRWYKFGRDVYRATVPGDEILVKRDGSVRCEDKVVVRSCRLFDKNADPQVRLLNQFYDDAILVRDGFEAARRRRKEKTAPRGTVLLPANGHTGGLFSLKAFGSSWYVQSRLHASEEHFGEYYYRFRGTIYFICTALIKSEEGTMTEAEKKSVHDVWNLWKAGWIVHGTNKAGKYVVS